MKRIFIIICFLVLPHTCLLANNKYVVTASELNVRAEPDINSKILTQVKYNQEIEFIEKTKINFKIENQDSFWIKIKANDTIGYIVNYYITNIAKNAELPPLFLNLTLNNGKIIKIQNRPYWNENYKIYTLLSHNMDIGFYILKEGLWEGYNFILTSDISGVKYTIIGNPIVSPNKKAFFALSIDLEAQYNDSGIEIYSVTENIPILKFKKMYTGKGNEMWGAKNGKWISDIEIEYVKEILFSDGRKQENIIKMKLVDNQWVEK